MSDGNRIPMNIDGSISQVPTKATAQGFVDKDAVGLFAVNYIDNNTVAGTLLASGNQADNIKYVFDEPNQKWTPMRSVYYKDVNTNVDIYLYYPYQSDISDVNESNFEVKKDQSVAATETALSGYEASDFLWGKVENVTPTESKVRIPLSHRLSAVQVTLVEGTGFETGEFESISKSVILTNTTRKAKIDFATGTATALGQPQLDGIVMCPQEGGEFRAIVIPQSMDANTKLFAITLDGVSYSFKQAAATVYQASKQTNVSITLNKKTPSGDYELTLGSTTIVDWTEDRNTHGGEARQYFVVNVETPGTLGETITAMGKNPAKIKNIKVTGAINESDFSFMRNNMTILQSLNIKEASVSQNAIPDGALSDKSTLYYLALPDNLVRIGNNAFGNTKLTGALVLPNTVTEIGDNAFCGTNATSLVLPGELLRIGNGAFSGCKYMSGDLALPDKVVYIGENAFNDCKGFSGRLHLPNSLEYVGKGAFLNAGTFVGGLRIPDKITSLGTETTIYAIFDRISGTLDLNNVTYVGGWALGSWIGTPMFSGELKLPEGIKMGACAFGNMPITSLVFPLSLPSIPDGAFNDTKITQDLVFPEDLVELGGAAFANCPGVTGLYLPRNLAVIGEGCFENDFNISKIVCESLEPPIVGAKAFNGVAKDNFALEVPEESISRYRMAPGWSDFKRITAHQNFNIDRNKVRVLNETFSMTSILRAPSGCAWRISEKPEWITVTPSSGMGRTDVTITIAPMSEGDIGTFEINEGTYGSPSYHDYPGRSGDIVFLLEEKEYTCTMTIEQYDCELVDGAVIPFQHASVGMGVDIVITGDGYDALDIAKGTFSANAELAYSYLFSIEPYKTYQAYFNVYAVVARSNESGIGTLNTITDNKFGSTFTQNRIMMEQYDDVFDWAKKADIDMDLAKSLVILLQNTPEYEGITYMYGDGSAIACCPISAQAYPYDFRGIIQHEAGGHGFGKLGDEYIYHNAFIQNCQCHDGCDHGNTFNIMKSYGWYKNLSMTGDVNQVPWSHLIYHPQYSNYVDVYEGGYMHSRGVYRSEVNSCMNNNIPYFSAISRQAIVERIMYCAGESFSLDTFYAQDKDDIGPATKSTIKKDEDLTFGVNPQLNYSTGHGPILVGDHPNVK